MALRKPFIKSYCTTYVYNIIIYNNILHIIDAPYNSDCQASRKHEIHFVSLWLNFRILAHIVGVLTIFYY